MATRRSAEELIDAVADGARLLFVERSPSAVSMREIAASADVNLGLIHRYVGSKEDVVALVLDRQTAAARRAVESSADQDDLLAMIARAVVHNPGTGRLIAGLILDGVDVTEIKQDFPLLDRLRTDGDGLDAALAYALALGWEVFGDALMNATGETQSADTINERLEQALAGLAG